MPGRNCKDVSSSIWPFSASEAQRKFRVCCDEIGLSWPGWHALRRGVASDMLDKGCTLSHVLRAGGWRSGAFLAYLSCSSLDRREAVEFALNDSDSDRDT